MKMALAENIRRFRKERSLTQEQLSEALGVTAGGFLGAKLLGKMPVKMVNLVFAVLQAVAGAFLIFG